jgi:C-terminal peptidase prc
MNALLSTWRIRQFNVRPWLLALVLPWLLALTGCDTSSTRQDPSPVTPTPTLLPVEARSAIFEEVWETVHTHYVFSNGRGADWMKLHDEYKPKALQASNVDEFYAAIKKMVEQLEDDHSGYLAPWEAREQDAFNSGNTEYAGIGISGQPRGSLEFMEYVYPDSPAEAAGLKRRDYITAVDGQPFTDADTESMKIRGPVGTSVRLTVRSPGQPPRDITIVRRHITGEENPALTQLESDPSIGYLLIPTFWLQDMDKRVEQGLLDFTNQFAGQGRTLKGLIIDLRSNEGGYGTATDGILGQFMEGVIGVTRLNDASVQYSHDPLRTVERGRLFDRLRSTPLVVLIDQHTQSNGEVFAAALQSKGRAKVVGTRSAGNTENVEEYNFSDGSRLWLATAYFELWDGTNLEGRGVSPDVAIDVDWTSYTEREDPHVLEAVKIIQQAAGN